MTRPYSRGNQPSPRDLEIYRAAIAGQSPKTLAETFFPTMKEPGRTKYVQKILRDTKERLGLRTITLTDVSETDADIIEQALLFLVDQISDVPHGLRRWTEKDITAVRHRLMEAFRPEGRNAP